MTREMRWERMEMERMVGLGLEMEMVQVPRIEQAWLALLLLLGWGAPEADATLAMRWLFRIAAAAVPRLCLPPLRRSWPHQGRWRSPLSPPRL